MEPSSHLVKLVLAALLGMGTPSLRAAETVHPVPPPPPVESVPFVNIAFVNIAFGSRIALVDLDRDHQPDGVAVLSSVLPRDPGFDLEIHLSGAADAHFHLQSGDPWQSLAAWDVDDDDDVDLVLEQSCTRQWLHLWLNDGHGGFTETQTRASSWRNRGPGQVLAAGAAASKHFGRYPWRSRNGSGTLPASSRIHSLASVRMCAARETLSPAGLSPFARTTSRAPPATALDTRA